MPRSPRRRTAVPSHRALVAGVALAGLASAPLALAEKHAGPIGKAERSTDAARAPAPRDDRFIGVDEVRPGMTGYGLTVFSGTTPDRFPIKVIGVLRNFLPQEDVILVESHDPRLEHAGIVAGMSGSPIYIDGPAGPRLAGALAYGWHFAKDPIAGVTPIANMLAELRRPLRGRESTPFAYATLDPRPPTSKAVSPASTASSGLLDGSSLVPVSVPLAISGLTPATFAELKQRLEPFGVDALSAGGGAPPPAAADRAGGKTRFAPGDAISVQLIRGDISAAGTGTVTWVDGDKVLAFGHPMFNLGELYLPIATAEIHTVLASLSTSFKIASPLREIGSLTQDRQSCIVGDTSQRAEMIPMTLTVNTAGRPGHVFHVEVLRHRFLTPLLAATVIGSAAQAAASDVADATITVRTALGVRGVRPLELTDHAFSADGFSARAMGAMSGIHAIADILFNPFAPASLERIDVGIDLDYRADVAEITGVQLASDALEPGSRPSLRVTLRPYNGAEYSETVPFDVPARLAGQLVKVEASAGNLVKPNQAAPERFDQLIDNLRLSYPARSIVVTVQAPDEGLALRGTVLSDLPASILDTLRPGASTRRGETFKETARVVLPQKTVVVGKQEIQVKIKDDPSP